MVRKNNIWKKLDWLSVFLYLTLVVMGWLNIYAAVYNFEHNSILDFTQKYGKQLIWIFAAILIIVMIFIIESRFFVAFGYVFHFVLIALLIGVLLVGVKVNGARSWVAIGSFKIQPAEFAKLTTALALAKFMSTFNFKINDFRNIVKVGLIVFIPATLILLQNDTGSALVYSTFIFVLYREGLPGWYLLLILYLIVLFILTLTVPFIYVLVFIIVVSLISFLVVYCNKKIVLVTFAYFVAITLLIIFINYEFLHFTYNKVVALGVVVVAIYLLFKSILRRIKYIPLLVGVTLGALAFSYSSDYIYKNVLIEHQRKRINNLLGIESDPLGAGYNVNQSKIAIGSGGFSGKGFLKGTQTKFDFVPEQSTDFIFCTVGEEWGFVGSSFILMLFVALFIRLIMLAERQRSRFSRVYGYSVVSILFFHVVVNVGMTIGLAPVIGIPLPFFSYGGSSLWAFTALLFIFLKLDANRLELL